MLRFLNKNNPLRERARRPLRLPPLTALPDGPIAGAVLLIVVLAGPLSAADRLDGTAAQKASLNPGPITTLSDVVGATRHEWKGSGQCRGAKIHALQDAVITGFDISLRETAGKRVRFHIYEAFYDDEKYAQIPAASTIKTGTIGEAFGWEDSPSIHVPVTAQKYYALVACWDPDDEAGYRGAAKIGPSDMSFGEYIGGTYYDSGGRPPDQIRWTTATHDYYLRVHSTAPVLLDGVRPFHDTDPFLDDPERGRPRAGSEDAEPLDEAACVIPEANCG